MESMVMASAVYAPATSSVSRWILSRARHSGGPWRTTVSDSVVVKARNAQVLHKWASTPAPCLALHHS